MNLKNIPVFYSFRRCPYAMRARLAIRSAGLLVELREVVLRDKPNEMIEASPKATVPVLVLANGTVVDESIDVMRWALHLSDPEGLFAHTPELHTAMDNLVAENDGAFKDALDRYKYPNRHGETDPVEQRSNGGAFIVKLEERLKKNAFLFGDKISFADLAILPFVRQFAHVDRDWFWSEDWKNVLQWLEAFLTSERFQEIMQKHPQWKSGNDSVLFGQ